ncbi:MAG: Ig-like domain-containing protein [Planctomycetota bacterium]|jgi:hypothetical protein
MIQGLSSVAGHGYLLGLLCALAFAPLNHSSQFPVLLAEMVEGEESPRMALHPEILDFGEVFAGQTSVRKLTITNQGNGDLQIRKITFTCSCALSRLTTPSGVMVDIKPKKDQLLCMLKHDESAELEIRFDTSGLLGDLKRSLDILSNDGEQKKRTMKMNVLVKSPFLAEPKSVDFGEVPKGEEASREIVIRSAGVGDFIVKKVENLPPFIRYEAKEIADADPPAWKLVFHLDRSAPVSELWQRIRLIVENETVNKFEIFIRAKILSDVSFHLEPHDRSGVLDLGKIDSSEGVKGTIEIRNRNPAVPYEITKLQRLCRFSDFIDTRIETLEEGVHYKISLEVRPGLKIPYLQGTLVIFSSHPEMARKRIKFMGRVE